MSDKQDVSPLDRFMRLFSDVRAGEGAQALLLALNIFMVLTAYSIMKPIREGLILSEWSAETKSYVAAAMVIILVPVVQLYGKLADRFPRMRLINTVTLFFVACLVAFFFLGQAGVPLAIPFFIWVGIFSGVVIAQFFSFANDVYTSDEGERLFPIVVFGATLGGVLGVYLTRILVQYLGVYQLMALPAIILALSLIITNYVDQRQRRLQLERETDEPARVEPLRGIGATFESLHDRRSAWAILDIVPGSFADLGGLEPGDRVLEIDGEPVSTITACRVPSSADQTWVRLTLERPGGPAELRLPVGVLIP